MPRASGARVLDLAARARAAHHTRRCACALLLLLLLLGAFILLSSRHCPPPPIPTTCTHDTYTHVHTHTHTYTYARAHTHTPPPSAPSPTTEPLSPICAYKTGTSWCCVSACRPKRRPPRRQGNRRVVLLAHFSMRIRMLTTRTRPSVQRQTGRRAKPAPAPPPLKQGPNRRNSQRHPGGRGATEGQMLWRVQS